MHVWDGTSTTKKSYFCVTVSRQQGLFLEKDGDYIYVNSGAELVGINEILGESKFTRQDFNDSGKADDLLSEISGLHQGGGRCPASSHTLRNTMGHDEEWLHGTEKSVAVLKDLFKDPQFVFEGDTWTVVFNVFKFDGSVDRWKVIGEHDANANKNQILNIEITPLKPARTFSWPYIG
jgi:hypothetical protein